MRQVYQGVDAAELLYVQTQFAELCGWLYQDAGDFRSAQFWTDRALEWSHATGVPDLTTFVLAQKSQLAGDMRDGGTAVDRAQAATAQARPETRLGAIAATKAAYGFALMGDKANADRTLDQAHELLSSHNVYFSVASLVCENFLYVFKGAPCGAPIREEVKDLLLRPVAAGSRS
ncbi:hypothetical protein [Nonomuraea sp. NPDC049750]|uniref:hypothetical protein n=1 Tax=Nonomuraea sp. NPDC049750 TaxID=3154738 RepID=UPI0033E5F382